MAIAQENENYINVDDEDALQMLVKLKAIQYNDSTVTYAFKQESLEKLDQLYVFNEDEELVLDFNQLHPLYAEAFRALAVKNIKLENQIAQMAVLIENLNIYIDNELNEINYEIYSIQNEIKP